MKLVAKCAASVSLSYQVHVQICNPIPLKKHFWSTPLPLMWILSKWLILIDCHGKWDAIHCYLHGSFSIRSDQLCLSHLALQCLF